MVCLPCCLYPLLSLLLAVYYRYLHPLVRPFLEKLWSGTPQPQNEAEKVEKPSSTGAVTAAAPCPFAAKKED